MTITQLARKAGVGTDTVRYYEKRGLLPKPPRRPSGYRIYDEEALRLLNFIRRAQTLGFSLQEIAELLALRRIPASACREVQAVAETKLRNVETKIRDLQGVRRALHMLHDSCQRTKTPSCPILESLEAQGPERKDLEKEKAP